MPFTLAANGGDRIFTIPVTVNAAALSGNDTISAAVNYIETISSNTQNIADSSIYDSWQVQVRPVLEITQVTVSRDTASTGQQSLLASVFVSNRDSSFVADSLSRNHEELVST